MGYRLKKSLLVPTAVVLLAGLLAGCAGTSGPSNDEEPAVGKQTQATARSPAPDAMAQAGAGMAPNAVPNQVTIDNFTFSPPQLTVAVGTKVTWVNRDDVPHTATSTARPKIFASGTLDTDDQFAHIFTAPGTYEYFCAVHPHMTGRIIVK